MPHVIRRAEAHLAGTLSELAEISKRHWGYDSAFVAATRHDIAVTPAQVRDNPCYLTAADGRTVGFYLLEGAELTRLFVSPDHIRQGIGRALMNHMMTLATRSGHSVITIVSDPNAAGFYRACGARPAGVFDSPDIPGRQLPVFELDLRTSRTVIDPASGPV